MQKTLEGKAILCKGSSLESPITMSVSGGDDHDLDFTAARQNSNESIFFTEIGKSRNIKTPGKVYMSDPTY